MSASETPGMSAASPAVDPTMIERRLLSPCRLAFWMAVFWSFLVPAFAPAVGAAEAPAGSFTLRDAVLRALENNFEIQIQRFNTDNAREALVAAEAPFDVALGLTARKSFTRQASAQSQLDGAAGPESDIEDTRLSASKRLPTGGAVEVSTRLNRNETNSQFATLNPAYSSDIAVNVTQPLLRNAGTGIARANIRRNTIGVARADLDLRTTAMNVVRDTELAYYRLLSAREQLRFRRLSLESAERFYEENKARRATGIATDLDVLTAEVGVANQRRNVLTAERAVRDAEDNLRALIGQFELDAPVGPGVLDPIATAVPTVDDVALRAKALQPEYLSLKAQLDQLRIDVETARNARLPEVNLGGTLGYNAREASARDAFAELPSGNGYQWGVNLTVNYPWGARGDGARYRQAINNLNRETLRLARIEQDILVQARAAIRAVETNRSAVEVSGLSLRLSEQQYELEKARYDAGLSTSRRVLDAQRDLDEARANELAAQLALREAITALNRLQGLILEPYGVSVGAAL